MSLSTHHPAQRFHASPGQQLWPTALGRPHHVDFVQQLFDHGLINWGSASDPLFGLASATLEPINLSQPWGCLVVRSAAATDRYS